MLVAVVMVAVLMVAMLVVTVALVGEWGRDAEGGGDYQRISEGSHGLTSPSPYCLPPNPGQLMLAL